MGMLILTRKIGESIVIGEGKEKVDITILNVRGNQIRVGINADKSISVHREEVFNRIKAEEAAK